MRRQVLQALMALTLAVVGATGCEQQGARGSSPQTSTMGISRDGATLYIAMADHDEVRAIDARTKAVRNTVAVVGHPHRLTVMADGRVAVTARHAGTVSVVNMETGNVDAVVEVGSDPFGVIEVDGDLLVAVSGEGDVARIDLDGEAKVAARIVTEQDEPRGLVARTDGTVLVSHYTGRSLGVIDTASNTQVDVVSTRLPSKPLFFPNQQDQLTLSPDEAEVAVPHVECNNDPAQFGSGGFAGVSAPVYYSEGPITGYPAIVPSVSRVDVTGRVVASDDTRPSDTTSLQLPEATGPVNPNINPLDRTLLEDQLVNGPVSVAFTAGGGAELVVNKGSGNVLVRRSVVRDNEDSVVAVVDVGVGAESIVLSPDAKIAYVYNAFDYTVRSFDVPEVQGVQSRFGNEFQEDEAQAPGFVALPQRNQPISKLNASSASVADAVLPADVMRGRELFHAVDQRITRNGSVSCNGCHSEGSDDQTTWTFAEGPRNSPPLWGGITGTEPFHWDASVRNMADISRVTIIGRMGGSGLGTDDMNAIGSYLDTIPAPAPRLTAMTAGESVSRGASLFATNCQSCHSGVDQTDNRQHDVGTSTNLDMDIDLTGAQLEFSTPPLKAIAHTAPYLHDGSAESLRDMIDRTVVRARSGRAMTTSRNPVALSSSDVDDLVAYLNTL
jgi:YVTN family beta-propeller protein